ncbi:MAG: DUF1292 domain-containing protein [Clostridia bacterium]|nr:DUF1292 domain-containing protein [Clostridia bacterium]
MSKKPENELDIEEEFEEPELIELIDEQGKVINFKLLDVTEYKGVKYTLLLAAEPNEEIAEDEVVIFRLNEKEETLEPVESEELLQEIFDFYQQEVDGEELLSDEEN